MAFCCGGCGFGCGGGYPGSAWQYYTLTGVVEEGCWPYPFPSCPNKCVASWNGPIWKNGLHFGSSYSLSGEQQMLQEIFVNGPVEATFDVYEDFLTYKSGVYQHVTGSYLGGHAVKIMGWGVEKGLKYWLVANSWNSHWGMNGFFKILRGVDECGIEDNINAGIPKS